MEKSLEKSQNFEVLFGGYLERFEGSDASTPFDLYIREKVCYRK